MNMEGGVNIDQSLNYLFCFNPNVKLKKKRGYSLKLHFWQDDEYNSRTNKKFAEKMVKNISFWQKHSNKRSHYTED